jgi:hypothetical protein
MGKPTPSLDGDSFRDLQSAIVASLAAAPGLAFLTDTERNDIASQLTTQAFALLFERIQNYVGVLTIG